MTLGEFIKKWAPIDEPDLKDVFTRDLFKACEDLNVQLPYRRTAIDVLSDIQGAELIMDTDPSHPEYPQGRLTFGKQGESLQTGLTVTYSLVWGQEEADWFVLLKEIAKQSLK